MKTIFNKLENEAKKWIYKNARAIDMARWQYHFENGCPEAVLNALVKYQNYDGGFGHGIEPDSWNPNSSPIQTNAAADLLWEIGFSEPDHPVITGILQYLDRSPGFNGRMWTKIISSNDDYPHAPWWQTSTQNMDKIEYNPSAALAGFGLCYSERKSELFEKCSLVAIAAVEHFIQNTDSCDSHTVKCYARLLDYCRTAEIYDVIDLRLLSDKLVEQVASIITEDTSLWAKDYTCRPSFFIDSPDSIYYRNNETLVDFECECITESRNAEGVWELNRHWSEWPREWAITESWLKGHKAIKFLLYLRSFGRL